MNATRAITINWAALLSFAIFWLWGVNAYPTGSALNDFPVNAGIVFLYSYCVLHYFSPVFRTIFLIKDRVIAIFFILSAIAVILSWRHLVQPLWGDQIYHANLAARHGQLAIFMIEQRFPLLWSMLKDMPASTIIWAVNFFMLCVFGFLFIWLPRLLETYRKIFLVFMLCILISARLLLSGESNIFNNVTGSFFLLNNYGADPHPIFRLFPIMLSSTILGVSDLGYRAAAFLGYLSFLLFIYIKLDKHVGGRIAFFAALSLGTLPILWHVSYLVEQSVWSTLGSASVFILLFTSKDQESIPLIPAVVFVIIATLLRSPAFIAFIPLAVVIGCRIFKDNIERRDRAPLLLMIAALGLFVLISVLRGSPATDSGGHLAKLIYAEINNIPSIAAVSVLGLTPFFFIGFALRSQSREDFVRFLAIVLFFVFCGLVYYSPVAQNLWGVGRYQAEMYIPLITAGVVAYCMALQKDRINQWYAVSPLILLAVINVFSLTTFDSRSFRPFVDNPTPGEAVKSEVEYQTNEAFQFIGEHNLEVHTYYIGIYYGGFISVLRGYSAEKYLAFSQLNNRYRNGFLVDAESIDADPEIMSVVIELEADSGVLSGLLGCGWKGRYDFTRAASPHTLTVLTREIL